MRAGCWVVALAASVWACGGDSSDDGTAGAAGTDGGSSGGSSASGGTAGSPAGGSSGTTTGGAAGTGGTSSGGAAGASGASAAGGTAGAGGGVQCNPGTAVCTAPPPQCPPGQVPSVQSGCWGPCVPILDCAAEPDCSNCTSGWCAAYVAFETQYRCVMPSIQCAALACSCLAQYFCVDPFSVCQTANPGPGAKVSCECPNC